MTARLKSLLAPLGRSAVTIVIVALAVLVALWLWKRYETDPWTRDGHIRADIVRVTPDVAGLVTRVARIFSGRPDPGVTPAFQLLKKNPPGDL